MTDKPTAGNATKKDLTSSHSLEFPCGCVAVVDIAFEIGSTSCGHIGSKYIQALSALREQIVQLEWLRNKEQNLAEKLAQTGKPVMITRKIIQAQEPKMGGWEKR